MLVDLLGALGLRTDEVGVLDLLVVLGCIAIVCGLWVCVPLKGWYNIHFLCFWMF